MHLKIVVANAAYKDRAGGSDLIQYELVPQLNVKYWLDIICNLVKD